MTCSKKAVPAWVAAVVLALVFTPGGAGAQETPAGGPDELPRQEFPEPVMSSLETALRVYEELRGELAADRLEGAHASASRLAAALRLALEQPAGLAEAIRSVIDEAAASAESMTGAEDLAAARVVFGEVSRLVLLLAGSDPGLVEGWHVFVCPMAESFGRWIQPTETLENPYMGQAMLACGAPTEWAAPAPATSVKAPSTRAADAQPEFKPGIPGLRMEDVRDKRFLWREIEELQVWEHGDRITIAEFRGKAIEKTAHYLELEGAAADEFTVTAREAVGAVRRAFRQRARDGTEPGAMEARFSADLQAAVGSLTAVLQDRPRHRLFEPELKKWLLRLAFGPKEAKEAKEAREAREAQEVHVEKSGRPSSGD